MREMLEYGMKHLKFAMELCEIQANNGLYFLFEHPAGATSWPTSPAQRMLRKKDVDVYEGDMRCYDMKQLANG